eukprot:PhF_6_TR35981/c0_g1_i1/m.52092
MELKHSSHIGLMSDLLKLKPEEQALIVKQQQQAESIKQANEHPRNHPNENRPEPVPSNQSNEKPSKLNPESLDYQPKTANEKPCHKKSVNQVHYQETVKQTSDNKTVEQPYEKTQRKSFGHKLTVTTPTLLHVSILNPFNHYTCLHLLVDEGQSDPLPFDFLSFKSARDQIITQEGFEFCRIRDFQQEMHQRFGILSIQCTEW